MFDPNTIALIGASEREDTVGRTILENLMASEGRVVFPINPKRESVLGLPCFPDIASVPQHVDLAVVAVPAAGVPDVLEECAAAGVDGAIVISAGFSETGEEGRKLEERVADVRDRYPMRILGPNCLGVIRPSTGLNASFVKAQPGAGPIALISQSGALGTAMLDWAITSHIGFSTFVSVGAMVDIDFADLVDFLGEDPHTRSILIYMESVGHAKRFMSAARSFARNKPIIVLKPGRYRESAQAAVSHTGSLAGDDDVYEAAFKRAGVVRVHEVADLFNAAQALDSKRLPGGPKLAIVTNAGGLGVMATDTLIEMGGQLPPISEAGIEHLNEVLPPYWSKGNPVDVLGDADSARYVEAVRTCVKDKGVDGVLVIYTPQGKAEPQELARAVVETIKHSSKPVLTVLMGGASVAEARDIFLRADVPSYDTPEEAIETYMDMYRYTRNLELLYETPAELPVDVAPPKNNLKALVRKIAKGGRLVLTEEESKRVLTVYGIPVTKQTLTNDLDDALSVAKRVGYPVVLKIVSPDITHKTAAGGVITDVCSAEELKEAYPRLLARVSAAAPDARILGVAMQPMVKHADFELIIGSKKDREFGAVMVFGAGGVTAEKTRDFSVGLPPLDSTLARRLMEETRIYRTMLSPPAGVAAPDLEQLEEVLTKLSNLVVDFPEIAEMDINPLILAEGALAAVDARIVIDPEALGPQREYAHLVITPYPTRYVAPWTLTDGTEILLRPIKPEDEPLEHAMLSSMSPETLRGRFLEVVGDITHEMLIRFTNIDYDREMAIVAEMADGKKKRLIGVGRLIGEPQRGRGEFAVVVHDDFQGKGLGFKLVDLLIGIAQDKGLSEIDGYVSSENRRMLKVCEELGFTLEPLVDGVTVVRLELQ
jgi:acetyltransferase